MSFLDALIEATLITSALAGGFVLILCGAALAGAFLIVSMSLLEEHVTSAFDYLLSFTLVTGGLIWLLANNEPRGTEAVTVVETLPPTAWELFVGMAWFAGMGVLMLAIGAVLLFLHILLLKTLHLIARSWHGAANTA